MNPFDVHGWEVSSEGYVPYATSDRTPTWSWTIEPGASVECGISQLWPTDGMWFEPLWQPCPNDSFTPPPVTDGPWTFSLRAEDEPGDRITHREPFLVDTVPPNTTFLPGGPSPGVTSNRGPYQFFFTAFIDPFLPAVPFRLECRFEHYTPDWERCFGLGSGYSISSPLDDGSYSFEARGIDLAGNVDPTPATRQWTVDTEAPQVVFEATPRKRIVTRKRRVKVKFEFFVDDATAVTLACKLDSLRAEVCPSRVSYRLGPGRHELAVSGTDEADFTSITNQYRFKIVRKKRRR